MKNFKVEYNVYNLATTTTEVESNSEYTEAETKEEAVANVIQCLHDQALNNGYKSEIKEDKLFFENEEFFNFTATEEKTGGKIMNKKLVENMLEYMNALNNGVNCKLMVNVTTGNTWVDMFTSENSWNEYENKDVECLSGYAQTFYGSTKKQDLMRAYKTMTATEE